MGCFSPAYEPIDVDEPRRSRCVPTSAQRQAHRGSSLRRQNCWRSQASRWLLGWLAIEAAEFDSLAGCTELGRFTNRNDIGGRLPLPFAGSRRGPNRRDFSCWPSRRATH